MSGFPLITLKNISDFPLKINLSPLLDRAFIYLAQLLL
jgi:hypothetical protein